MKNPTEIFMLGNEEKFLPILNISTYFSKVPQNLDDEYNLAKEFSKINPILDKIPTFEILEQDRTNLTFQLEPTKPKPNYLKIQKEEHLEIAVLKPEESKIVGLENILNTPNNSQSNILLNNNYGKENGLNQNNLSYTNQTIKGLDYKLGKSRYNREFAWYDIPKQNIVPGYYRRH